MELVKATYRTEGDRVSLVRVSDGVVLMSRRVPKPRILSPIAWDCSGISRGRSEFVRYVMKNGIEVV